MRNAIHIWLGAGLLALLPPVANGQFVGTVADSARLPNAEIANLMDEIEAKTARKAQIEKEGVGLAEERRETRETLRERVSALYKVQRIGILPVAGGFEALIRHVARVKRLRRLAADGLARLHRLRGRNDALQEEAVGLDASIATSKKRLEQLRDRASRSRGRRPRQGIITYSRATSGYGTDSERSGESEFYGIRVVGGGGYSRGFPDQRGDLNIPISGEFVVRDARRPESDGPGLEFLAPAGTRVRAASAGRVGFSGRHGSYGRLVILDHGDSYFTVYGGLGAVDVRVGDDLSRNARIGTIGDDAMPPALFFEVRRGTKTLPPRDWLGL
jgi:septal ring factor EnvC (AmiA/AmiB activator)